MPESDSTNGRIDELSDFIAQHAKVIDRDHESFIFSHRNAVMSIYFQGGSWLLSLPLLLGVTANGKLFKTLVAETSTGGDGSWTIGRISSTNKTNLWKAKLFWTPNNDEILHTITNWSFGFREDLDSFGKLDGSAASLDQNYSTLDFHKSIAWYGVLD